MPLSLKYRLFCNSVILSGPHALYQWFYPLLQPDKHLVKVEDPLFADMEQVLGKKSMADLGKIASESGFLARTKLTKTAVDCYWRRVLTLALKWFPLVGADGGVIKPRERVEEGVLPLDESHVAKIYGGSSRHGTSRPREATGGAPLSAQKLYDATGALRTLGPTDGSSRMSVPAICAVPPQPDKFHLPLPLLLWQPQLLDRFYKRRNLLERQFRLANPVKLLAEIFGDERTITLDGTDANRLHFSTALLPWRDPRTESPGSGLSRNARSGACTATRVSCKSGWKSGASGGMAVCGSANSLSYQIIATGGTPSASSRDAPVSCFHHNTEAGAKAGAEDVLFVSEEMEKTSEEKSPDETAQTINADTIDTTKKASEQATTFFSDPIDFFLEDELDVLIIIPVRAKSRDYMDYARTGWLQQTSFFTDPLKVLRDADHPEDEEKIPTPEQFVQLVEEPYFRDYGQRPDSVLRHARDGVIDKFSPFLVSDVGYQPAGGGGIQKSTGGSSTIVDTATPGEGGRQGDHSQVAEEPDTPEEPGGRLHTAAVSLVNRKETHALLKLRKATKLHYFIVCREDPDLWFDPDNDAEVAQNPDILVVDAPHGYRYLTEKMIAAYKVALEMHPGVRLFLRSDVDNAMVLQPVFDYLPSIEQGEEVRAGRAGLLCTEFSF